jgi:hypothetical protein
MLKKIKKVWNDHKGLVITTGLGIGAGLCYLMLSKNAEEENVMIPEEEIKMLADEACEETFKNIPDDCCLVDGEVKPIYENGDETRIYDYAFENDQVKEEFRELGYTIVESH